MRDMSKDLGPLAEWAVSHIDRDALQSRLDELGRITARSGQGITRLGYTCAESLAHNKVMDGLRRSGFTIHCDPFLNSMALLGATSGEASRLLLLGSHLDSVPNGGAYDGALGVVLAAEIARLISSWDDRPFDIGVVAWRCEESARFNVGRLGSRAWLGEISYQEGLDLKDDAGISLVQAIADQGGQPDSLGTASPFLSRLHSYWEAHIEQGPVLHQRGIPVGVVTGISNQTRIGVTVQGQTMHSGGTPMVNRRDALACAAEMIVELESIVRIGGGPSTVGHVGKIQVAPGRANTVAGTCSFVADIRDMDAGDKKRVADLFTEAAGYLAAKRGLAVEITTLYDGMPQLLPDWTRDLLRGACRLIGTPCHELPSGGGHDANNLSRHVPVGMLFVPSPDGLSHSPGESACIDDVVKVAQVLCVALGALMKGSGEILANL